MLLDMPPYSTGAPLTRQASTRGTVCLLGMLCSRCRCRSLAATLSRSSFRQHVRRFAVAVNDWRGCSHPQRCTVDCTACLPADSKVLVAGCHVRSSKAMLLASPWASCFSSHSRHSRGTAPSLKGDWLSRWCRHPLQGDGTPFAAAWGAKRRTAARKGDLPAETPAGKALLAALHTGKGLS